MPQGNTLRLWPWREFALPGNLIPADLSERLRLVDPDVAELVSSPNLEIGLVDTPYLPTAKVYKLLSRTGTRVELEYVGVGADGAAIVLTSDMPAFERMAQADGIQISDPRSAIDYASAAIEIGRNLADLLYVVGSVDDVWFRQELDDGEEAVRRSFEVAYRGRIRPPTAERLDNGYRVTAYYIRRENLECHRTLVAFSGRLDDRIETLETDLPVVLGGS